MIKSNEKNSNHPIKKLKESDILKKDYVPEVYTEVNQLNDEELEYLISNLKDIQGKHREEIEQFEKKTEEISKRIDEQQDLITNVRNDKDLYRDLHCKEQRQRNEKKFLIENQKKFIENIVSIPNKSPKRPSSQGISRQKK